jgi:integrase
MRGKSELRRSFTRQELATIVEAARADWGATSEHTLLLTLAIYTGARLQEVCGLRHAELRQHPDSPDAWFLEFKHNKHRRLKTGDSERVVPVHADLLPDVRAHAKNVEPDGLLFPSMGPANVQNKSNKLSAKFRALMHRAGIVDKRATWHSFRHTFSDHAKETIPDAGRHAIMGHAEPGSSGVYGNGAGLRKLVEWTAMLDPLGRTST